MPRLVYTGYRLIDCSNRRLPSDLLLTLYREKRKHAGKAVSRQTVGTGSTGDDITRKCVCCILHGADENAQVAPRKGDNSSGRARPRDVLSSGPSEPEEAERQAKASNHGGIQSVLRRDLVRRIVGNLRSVEEDFAGHDGGEAKETADNNGDEHQARLVGGKVIYRTKGVRNAAEEAEEGTKVDRDVEADEGDDWLGEQHLDGSNGGYHGKRLDARAHGRKWRELDAVLLGETALENGVKCLSVKAPETNG